MPPSADDIDEIFLAACDTGELTVLRQKTARDPALVNRRDGDGTPPLWRAAAWARTEVVEFLLEHGADAALTDKHGETALQVAERLNYESIAAVLKDAEARQRRERKAAAFRQEMDALSKGLRQFTAGLQKPVTARRPARFGKPSP